MTCTNCGGAIEMTHNEGGTTEGSFREEYQCVDCGARGVVRGDAGASPSQWRRSGGVF